MFFMVKVIFISFFLISLSACYDKRNNLKITNSQNILINYNSKSGRYLSANYSILKGDYINANKILRSKNNDLTLLKLEFFSNLLSGNFEIANNISKENNFQVKDQFLYKIPDFATNLKKITLKVV